MIPHYVEANRDEVPNTSSSLAKVPGEQGSGLEPWLAKMQTHKITIVIDLNMEMVDALKTLRINRSRR